MLIIKVLTYAIFCRFTEKTDLLDCVIPSANDEYFFAAFVRPKAAS